MEDQFGLEFAWLNICCFQCVQWQDVRVLPDVKFVMQKKVQ